MHVSCLLYFVLKSDNSFRQYSTYIWTFSCVYHSRLPNSSCSYHFWAFYFLFIHSFILFLMMFCLTWII